MAKIEVGDDQMDFATAVTTFAMVKTNFCMLRMRTCICKTESVIGITTPGTDIRAIIGCRMSPGIIGMKITIAERRVWIGGRENGIAYAEKSADL